MPEIAQETIDEAVRTGWTPQDQFKGDPDRWRPADEWVERGKEFIPFIKAQNRELKTDLDKVSGELAKTRETMDKMAKVQTKYATASYDDKVSNLNAEKDAAVAEADVEKVKEIDGKIAKLDKPEEEQDDYTVAASEMAKRSWSTDPEMVEHATAIGQVMANARHPLAAPGNAQALVEEVDKRLRAMFPAKFENPNRQNATIDEPETRGAPVNHPGPKGWNDLDQDAQDHCTRMCGPVSEGGVPNMTKEKYIKAYFEVE